jgi:hypothetical protein
MVHEKSDTPGRIGMGLLIMILATLACSAENSLRLRPAAVPLVAHDPYFSIWSAPKPPRAALLAYDDHESSSRPQLDLQGQGWPVVIRDLWSQQADGIAHHRASRDSKIEVGEDHRVRPHVDE